MLTKGDNNRVDDRGLYAPGQLWLQREDILGRAKGTLRYLGMVTIILNDYPVLKYVLIGEIWFCFECGRERLMSLLDWCFNSLSFLISLYVGIMGIFVLTNKES